MISIVEAISELLFVRDTVVVPGLGAFVRHEISAKVDEETNRFVSPSCEVGFDANHREDNDLIINYIAERNDWNKTRANQQLMLFVTDTFDKLKKGEKVVLERIGTLSYNSDNELVFEPDNTVNYNPDSFGLHDFNWVATENEEVRKETMQKAEEKNDAEPEEDSVKVEKGVWVIMLALALVLSGWFYYKVFLHKDDYKEQYAETQTQASEAPSEGGLTEEKIAEMVDRMIREELSKPYYETPRKDTIRIIAGCYDQVDFAQRVVISLRNKGFPNAFMEQHGERWFVAYDRYHTEEEAYAALREIRESGKGKGWILK